MKGILYHYVHCPYCIRVRMVAGFLEVPYESKILRYDDEQTPVKLSGRKMLPVWVNESGNAINESLDIIPLIDEDNYFKTKEVMASAEWKGFQEKLDQLSGSLFSLCMPYFIWTKEFDEKSRTYFQRKKEEKRGPFEVLIKNKKLFEKDLNSHLVNIEKDLKEFYMSDRLNLYDVVLASHLWGMYLVPEFQFSEKLHGYLQRVKEACHFDYHADYWK